MIKIELGELYGCESYKELTETINHMKRSGMSDEQIQEILDKSKGGK